MKLSPVKIREGLKHFIFTVALPITIPLSIIIGRFNRNNICMFHIGRCGSTVIGDLLGNHQNISWQGEIYSNYFINEIDSKTNTGWDKFYGTKVLKSYMRGVIRKYFGFEIKHAHLKKLSVSYTEYITTLKQNGFDRFIVLERSNYLRSILSYTIAKETNRWHIHSKNISKLSTIYVNTNKVCLEYEQMPLIQALKIIDDYYFNLKITLDNLNIKFQNINYEIDIEKDPFIAYRKICSFLDLPPQNPKIRFTRTNPFPLSELISNYEEVENYLKGSKFEWMLNENIGQ